MNHLPKTEPIRKPQTKLEYAIKRNRTITLAINSPLARFNGRLSMVPEPTRFHNTMDLLNAVEDLDSLDGRTFHRHMGSSGELTLQVALQFRKCLERWRQAIESRPAGMTAENRTLQRDEIKRRELRLKFAEQALQSRDLQLGSPFLLSSDQQREFEQAYSAQNRMTPGQRQRARFIYWAGGIAALRRYTSSIHEISCPEQPLRKIESCIEWILSLLARWDRDPNWVVAHEFQVHQPLHELVKWSRANSMSLSEPKGPFPARLEKTLSGLRTTRDQIRRFYHHSVPRCLAAWSICAHSGDELARPTIRKCSTQTNINRLSRAASCHVEASQQTAYPKLLASLNANNLSISGWRLTQACLWLLRGDKIDDVTFCLKHLDVDAIPFSLSVARVVDLAKRTRKVLNDNDYDFVVSIIRHLDSNKKLDIVNRLLQWLETFPNLAINNKTRKLIKSTMMSCRRLLVVEDAECTLGDRVRQWSSRAHAVAQCYPDESSYPKQLRGWLRKLGYYQRLSNAEFRVPQFLRRSMEAHQKRIKEIRFLTHQIENGNTDQKLRDRLTYLSQWQTDEVKTERRHIRSIQEACVYTGLEALRQMVVQEAAHRWTSTTQHPIHPSWSDKRTVEMASWLNAMDATLQRSLRLILDGYAEHGAHYKSQLKSNQRWIGQMRRKDFNIDPWLNPPTCLTKIDRQPVKISVSSDPYEIFMMGNYFGTCLSQGGCNQHSVVVNALEANKQVIYVHDMDGNVLARQLITISQQNELLRYCLYISTPERSGHDKHAYFDAALAQYCQELASRIRIKRGTAGAPTSLSKLYWYDDEPEKWPANTPDYQLANLQFSDVAYPRTLQWIGVSSAPAMEFEFTVSYAYPPAVS